MMQWYYVLKASVAVGVVISGMGVLASREPVTGLMGQFDEPESQLSKRVSAPLSNQAPKADESIGDVATLQERSSKGSPDSVLVLTVNNDRRSIKMAAMLQELINRRFHERVGIEQVGMAKAKTDGVVILGVPRAYRHAKHRYLEVVRHLPLVENKKLRDERLGHWGGDLRLPDKSEEAALRLEGMGPAATAALKSGLSSPDARTRFFAAEALAFLGDGSGAAVLGDEGKTLAEFRERAVDALMSLHNGPTPSRD